MTKRILISEIEDALERANTPLSRLINFGPVTLPEFEAIGIRTFGQLEELGWEEVCRRWVENFPERLNVNAFIGIIATFEGIPWTKISPSEKAQARRWVNELRREFGMPGAKTAGSRPRWSKLK